MRIEFNPGAKIEITNFDGAQLIFELAEDVFRLEIAMSDALLMQKLQKKNKLKNSSNHFDKFY